MNGPSWTPLHAHLHQTLRDRSLLEPDHPVLVAVSGGQDSLCLTRLLLDLQPKWGWNLAIAHCDHRWREDSEANAVFVRKLAEAWQLPFYLQIAEQVPVSEAAARNWRYQWLGHLAQQQGYRYVVTGHTASDRAETLLYNLIRGSGIDGLQALTWKRSLTDGVELVRPLLAVTRYQTAQFCQQADLQIWEDSTNQNLKYARNRIRLQLLPYLSTHLNPQVEQHLAHTAELLQGEVDFLESEAMKLRQQTLPENQISFPLCLPLRLNRRVLQAAPLALQRRVIRQILQQILPGAPTFEHIEKLVALIPAPHRSQTDPFPGGAIAQVEADWIWLQHPEDQEKS